MNGRAPCGVCSLLAAIFRRLMCMGGSRRGSGDSCYQELPNDDATNAINATVNRSEDSCLDQDEGAVLIRVYESAPKASELEGCPAPLSPPPLGPGSRRPSPSTLDWLLLGALDTRAARPLHTGRFLTMHKRRRRRLTTRSLNNAPALLDDVHHGMVQCVLDRASLWPFNAFTLDTVTGGRSLPVLCVHLFHWYGLMDHFNLDVVRIWKLFSLVEEGYHGTNPYHNSIHATDVTQAMHCFLQEEKIRKYLTPLEIMASLIAAVTHDLDHPGVNQPFLIATSNHLAALYENTSVLENHHWRSAVGCLLESSVADQLQHCRREMEAQIASLILATDITRQAEFLTKFKKYLDEETLDMTRAEDRHFILQIALKCADISNPCRPWDVSRKWSQKVCEEFFRQGDYERQLNLPVTSLCDRTSTSVPKIQTGFYKCVVSPLIEEWHRFLDTPLSHSMMSHLRSNHSRWDQLLQHEADQEIRTEISEAESQDAEAEKLGNEEEIEVEDNDQGSKEHLLSESPRRPSLPLDSDQATQSSSAISRRHSVPLSMPSLPKTFVRTEVPVGTDRGTCRRFTLVPVLHLEEDETSGGDIALDDLLGHSQLSLLSSCSSSAGGDRSCERPVSAENLLPEPSIASITTSTEASRLSTVLHGNGTVSGPGSLAPPRSLTRQQTFPPLQPYVRARYMSTTAEMSTCTENVGNTGSRSSSSDSGRGDLATQAKPDDPSGNSPSTWAKTLRSNNQTDSSSTPSTAIKRPEVTDRPSKASKLARLSISDPAAAEKLSLAAAALRLIQKENVDPTHESLTLSPTRKNAPQGLVLRRGSAPVTLSPREDAPPGLSVPFRPGTERYCRRGSVPVDVSRQSVLRPLISKENVSCLSPTAPSINTPSTTHSNTSLNANSGIPRRSSLPHDLVRQSLALPGAPSPLNTPLTAPPGFGAKEGEGGLQQRVFWDSVGNILLWPPESSQPQSESQLSSDLLQRLSAPDRKLPGRSPASTSLSAGGYVVNKQLHYLDIRRSSVPTDISLELLRRLTEQPTGLGRPPSNNNNINNGKARNSRGKKVLRRRSSGGPETFVAQAGPDWAVDSSTWQRWRREVLLACRLGVTDPGTVLDPALSRRRGSLPIEVLAASQSGLRSPDEFS